MKLNEVSKIEVKTFPIDNIQDFAALNLDEKLVELEKHYGLRFKPAELIKEMAESGRTFYQE